MAAGIWTVAAGVAVTAMVTAFQTARIAHPTTRTATDTWLALSPGASSATRARHGLLKFYC